MSRPSPTLAIDIRAQRCPMTWVRVKLALDQLATGQVLEVQLAEGEPLQNVPRSAEAEGHAIVGAEPAAQGHRIWIEKGGT